MSTYSIDWGQFLLQSWPTLLMYLAGLVIALVMMGQHRIPAMLVLIAMILLLVTTFLPLFTNRIISSGRGSGESIRQGYIMMGMAFGVMRAIAVGLLVWAAFAGRPRNLAVGHGFGLVPPQYSQGMHYPPPHNPAGYDGGMASPGGPPPGGRGAG